MKKYILALFLVCSVGVWGQNVLKLSLWSGQLPNSNGLTGDEEWVKDFRSHVDAPMLTVYLPQKANGKAIIACPGGGYGSLAVGHEGHQMADWFNRLGFVYAVLQYRMPNCHHDVPLSDAEQAMRLVKSHAAEWGISPDKIGIMGSSAGGHLASTLATHFKDDVRPAFQILFYPVITMDKELTHAGSRHNLIGPNPSKELVKLYSNELQVTSNTPPAFISLSGDDDEVPVENSIRYYQALIKHNVPVALHIYPSGGHGWGYLETFKYKKEWTFELEEWLRSLD